MSLLPRFKVAPNLIRKVFNLNLLSFVSGITWGVSLLNKQSEQFFKYFQNTKV